MDMELQVRALSSSWGPQRKSTAGHGLSLRHWVGIEMIWDERVWIMAFAGLLRFLSCSSQNTSSVHSLNQHSKPSVVTSCGYKNGWHIKLYEYDIQTGPLFTVLSFTGPQMEFHTVAIQRERRGRSYHGRKLLWRGGSLPRVLWWSASKERARNKRKPKSSQVQRCRMDVQQWNPSIDLWLIPCCRQWAFMLNFRGRG